MSDREEFMAAAAATLAHVVRDAINAMPFGGHHEEAAWRVEVGARLDTFLRDLSQGWITWPGGNCPLEMYDRIEVRYRGGSTSRGNAGTYVWKHGHKQPTWRNAEVVAYRRIGNE